MFLKLGIGKRRLIPVEVLGIVDSRLRLRRKVIIPQQQILLHAHMHGSIQALAPLITNQRERIIIHNGIGHECGGKRFRIAADGAVGQVVDGEVGTGRSGAFTLEPDDELLPVVFVGGAGFVAAGCAAREVPGVHDGVEAVEELVGIGGLGPAGVVAGFGAGVDLAGVLGAFVEFGVAGVLALTR